METKIINNFQSNGTMVMSTPSSFCIQRQFEYISFTSVEPAVNSWEIKAVSQH